MHKERISSKPTGLGWQLPFGHNPGFRGREGEFQELDKRLMHRGDEGQTLARAVLKGGPGTGKSTLAVEWCWYHVREFPSLLWVDASSPQSIERDLIELAGILATHKGTQLDLKDAASNSVLLARILNWLQVTPGWIIIADNCDSTSARETLQRSIRDGFPGRLLVTSRLYDWPPIWEAMHVDILPEDSAMSLNLSAAALILRLHNLSGKMMRG
jgi:hypothetical protein